MDLAWKCGQINLNAGDRWENTPLHLLFDVTYERKSSGPFLWVRYHEGGSENESGKFSGFSDVNVGSGIGVDNNKVSYLFLKLVRWGRKATYC